MKMLLILIPIAFSIFATNAFSKENYGRRYKSTYGSFDNGFFRQYHYRETNSSCRFHTCMEATFKRTDTVYIEETIIYDRTYGEQRMVRVYENARYDRYIVTYYVENNGPRSRVRARRYNEHSYYYNSYYYYTPYIMPGLIITADMMDNFDNQSAKLLLAGGIVIDFGLNLATSCRTHECSENAGQIALIGIASTVAASVSNELNKNKDKTELENQINFASSSSADAVF